MRLVEERNSKIQHEFALDDKLPFQPPMAQQFLREAADTKMRDTVFAETGIEERDIQFNC